MECEEETWWHSRVTTMITPNMKFINDRWRKPQPRWETSYMCFPKVKLAINRFNISSKFFKSVKNPELRRIVKKKNRNSLYVVRKGLITPIIVVRVIDAERIILIIIYIFPLKVTTILNVHINNLFFVNYLSYEL